MRLRLVQSLLVVSVLSLAGSASAHFELLEPKASSDTVNGGKGGKPCGPDGGPGTPIPVTGGSMLTIKVNETTPHPGHYRVALALNARSDFMTLQEPAVMDEDGKVITNGTSASAVIQSPPVFPVIGDGILAHTSGGGMQTGMVALPNVNCDHCVLQVIEFMAQHGPDYFYRHCADLKITADPGKPIFDPSGMGGTGGTGSGGAAGAGGAGTAGSPAGGTPGTAGAPGGGSPGTAGSPTGGTLGTAGSVTSGGAPRAAGTGTSGGGDAEDDGSCSVSSVGTRSRAGGDGQAGWRKHGRGGGAGRPQKDA
jgi:hypothetical protein